MSSMSDPVSIALSTRNGAGLPSWARSLSDRAANEFKRNGFPTRRVEAWKYTSLRPLEALLSGADMGKTERAEAVTGHWPDVTADFRVVMAGGSFSALKGAPANGVRVLSLAEALADSSLPLEPLLASLDISHPSRSLAALNTAALEEGLLIHVPGGVDAGLCLLRWSGTPGLVNSRVCLVLEEGARLELLEQFDRVDGALNLVTQAELAGGACLLHARLQDEGQAASLITQTEVRQARKSQYSYTGLDLGGGLVRHDLRAQMQGAGAQCKLSGAYLPGGASHVDYHLEIEHQAPNCTSGQFFRGVLKDRGKAVFNGRVHVHPGADGTETRQSNANLLLSPHAEVFTKPELEIEADEVVASHGATVGQLDEDAVFYLRTRGLDEDTARQVLMGAFCQAVIDELPDGPVRAFFTASLAAATGASA